MNAISSAALGIAATVAGVAIGRPTSGRWLFRYCRNSDPETSYGLPEQLEELCVFLAERARAFYGEVGDDWFAIDANCYRDAEMFLGDAARKQLKDLYTTVGGFMARWHEDGSLQYSDVYDWNPGGVWYFNLAGIPLQGNDSYFVNAGVPFVTAGVIQAEAVGAAMDKFSGLSYGPYDEYVGLSLAKQVISSVMNFIMAVVFRGEADVWISDLVGCCREIAYKSKKGGRK